MTASAKEVIAAAIPKALEVASPLAFVGEHREGRETTVDGSFEFGAVSDAILAALDAAGYVVVPREPTEAMIAAINTGDFPAASKRRAPSIYRAMIAAQESLIGVTEAEYAAILGQADAAQESKP